MRRLGLVLGCALIASTIAPQPAHAHVRIAGGGTAAVHVTAGQPISVSPAGPRNVTLSQGQGSVSGTLVNPNAFHRWGRRVNVTVTSVSSTSGQCKVNQITLQPVAPPAGGAAVAPNGALAWSVTVSGAGSNCRNATVTVTYPPTQ
jgi:hypothetical protein